VNQLTEIIDELVSNNQKEKIAEVEVVNSVDEAKIRVHFTNIMIFVTAGLLRVAREFKELNPRLSVIVLTGLIPEDEIDSPNQTDFAAVSILLELRLFLFTHNIS